MKFSIVTVCYNVADKLEDTIKSVIGQKYHNIEYIIIDGLSNDGTVEIIKKHSKDVTLWISEKDKGVYDAMNKGIMMASGDYINFMNAGDVFYNDYVLKELAERVNSLPSVFFGDMCIYRNGVKSLVKAKPFYEHLPLHHTMGFNHQCTFVKLDVAKRNLFDLNYKLAADYNMIISIYRAGGDFFYVKDCVVAIYEGNGLSDKGLIRHTYEKLCVDNPGRYILNAINLFLIIAMVKIKILGRKILGYKIK